MGIDPADKMMSEQTRARDVLADLLDVDEGLWDNEIKFLEDLSKNQLSWWTDKQIDWLDKIYIRINK